MDGVAFRRERELSVLGHAALRDVHAREDLDARDDLGGDVEGNALLLDHLAVHAEADVHAIALRLEMDVAGVGADRAADDFVEDDDGALLEVLAHDGGRLPEARDERAMDGELGIRPLASSRGR